MFLKRKSKAFINRPSSQFILGVRPLSHIPDPMLLIQESLPGNGATDEQIGSRSTTSIAESTKPTGPDTGLDVATSVAGDISAFFGVLLLPSPLLIVRPGQLDMTLDQMSS